MDVQYVSDNNGHITAIQVSIEDWERLKLIHPDITNIDSPLPKWQTDILDKRLDDIKNHPEHIKPISKLMDILHQDVD